MYHFSAPMISLKPSEELSDPLLPLWEAPGIGNAFACTGDVDRWYGVACCLVGWNWPELCTTVVVVVVVVVAPGDGDRVFVVIVRVVLEVS